MRLLIGLVVALSPVFVGAFTWQTLSSDFYFTKRIAPGLFAGGWPTDQNIQSLAKAGFKSILSTSYNKEGVSEFNGVSGNFLSSDDEVAFAESLGMEAQYISSSYTKSSVERVSSAIHTMPKPAGYAASLFAELHLYLSGAVDATDIYSNSLTLGWDYQSNPDTVQLITAVTGYTVEVSSPSIELTLAEGEDSYKYYFWSHWLGNDAFYNMGQPLSTQVQAIADAGYKAVISFRNTGESTSCSNVANCQNYQFIDASGNYNVTEEQLAFEAVGIKFYNLPVTGSDAWTTALLDAYTPYISEAASYGPVFAHCASGYRSSAYLTAYLARQAKQCSTWAVTQARRVGFSFDILEADEKVMNFYQDALGC